MLPTRSALDDYPLSTGILLACGVLFAATDLHLLGERGASLKEWGINWPPGLARGEAWRLVTSMFLHGGFLHVLLNGYGLWQLCPAVERSIGTARFAVIYFGAGIAGSVASSAFDPASLGASGALFGVMATWIRFFRIRHGSFAAVMRDPVAKQFVMWTLLSLAMGLTGARISNAGHIGGFAGGWAFSAALLPALKGFDRGRVAQKTSWPRLAAVLLLLAAAGVGATRVPWNGHLMLAHALDASRAGDTPRALALLARSRAAPFGAVPSEFGPRGIEEHKAGREAFAEALYRAALEEGDEDPAIANNLALILRRQDREAELLQHLRACRDRGQPLKDWEAELKALEAKEKRR